MLEDYYTNNFPEDASAQDFFDRGKWLQEQGSYEKAIENFSAAIELEPSASVLKQAAGVHIKLRQWDQAIECFDQLVKLQPNNIYFFRNRSQCELISKGLEIYRERCREAIERFLTPEASTEEKRVVAVLCSLVPRAVDDTGAIVELASEVAAVDPSPTLSSRGILAKSLLNDGQVDQALTMLHELASNDKVGICFNLAIAYQMSGKPDVAKQWLEKGNLRLAEQMAKGEFYNGHFRLDFLITQQEAHQRLGIPLPDSAPTMAPETTTTK
jgi:tetratricopeptide (TPR) repeat protein